VANRLHEPSQQFHAKLMLGAKAPVGFLRQFRYVDLANGYHRSQHHGITCEFAVTKGMDLVMDSVGLSGNGVEWRSVSFAGSKPRSVGYRSCRVLALVGRFCRGMSEIFQGGLRNRGLQVRILPGVLSLPGSEAARTTSTQGGQREMLSTPGCGQSFLRGDGIALTARTCALLSTCVYRIVICRLRSNYWESAIRRSSATMRAVWVSQRRL